MKTTGHTCTQRGADRAENQDLCLVNDALGLYAITDGMGTDGVGLEAARITVDTIEAYVRAASKGDESPEHIVVGAIEAANGAVFAAGLAGGRVRQMACSITLVLVDEDTLVIGQLGDTRAFLVRDGVVLLTRDDTLRSELVAGGRISEQRSWTTGHQHVLTKAVGLFSHAVPRVTSIPMTLGDRMLLASNGAYRSPTGTRPLWRYIDGQSSGSAVEKIVESAVDAGDDDDVTALLIDVEGDLPESREGLERLRAHPLFSSLPLSVLVRLRNLAWTVSLNDASDLAKAGDELSTMYLVLEGSLMVQEGDRRTSFGPGSIVGYSRLLWSAKCTGDLSTDAPVELLAISQSDFRSLARRRPWLGLRTLFELSAYMADNPDPV